MRSWIMASALMLAGCSPEPQDCHAVEALMELKILLKDEQIKAQEGTIEALRGRAKAQCNMLKLWQPRWDKSTLDFCAPESK